MDLDIKYIILITVIVCIGFTIFVIRNEKENFSDQSKSCPCGASCKCADKKLAVAKVVVKLWTEHLLYTRLAIMALLTNAPDANAMATRLMCNPQDFGVALAKLYNKSVGDAVSKLLTEHLQIAVKVVQDVKSNSTQRDNDIRDLYSNADQIGSYLDKLTNNNNNLFKHHMKMHIDTLLANVTAFVSNNYQLDVKTLDAYINAGLDMAFAMI